MKGGLLTRWNPDNLEMRSRSVEEQIMPLVMDITTLTNPKNDLKKKGRSKKGKVLVYIVEKAVASFVQKGEEIASENPEVQEEMLKLIDKIRITGQNMSVAAAEFVANPTNSEKRAAMVQSSRYLLIAVIRLLILADMLDQQPLFRAAESVEATLEKLKTTPYDRLLEELKQYQKNQDVLQMEALKRQNNFSDPKIRDNMAAARAVLKKSSTMLLSASKVYAAHPDVPAAKDNKDRVLKQVCEAVDTINAVTWGKTKPEDFDNLASNLDSFSNLEYKEVSRQKLEQQLDELVKGAALLSESIETNERKDKILQSCNAVKSALQNLLTQSLKKNDAEESRALDDVTKKSKILSRQLKKALADQVTNTFLDPTPLQLLVEAAKCGDLAQVEICSGEFAQHCQKLLEIADQVCQLSNNPDGIKLVRFAASQLAFQYPVVIDGAKLLAQKPKSAVALENMSTLQDSFNDQLKILLDAVDDITTIDDVLSVMDSHIYDDLNGYMQALKERDPKKLLQISSDMQSRVQRIIDVVSAEMDNYEPCTYTRTVLQALKVLNEEIMSQFGKKVEEAVKLIDNGQPIDDNEFIDATRLVYEGVRDVRRAVLMNKTDGELDPEEVELEYSTDTLTKSVDNVVENSEDMSGITVARQAMSQLPEKEKKKILDQVKDFQSEKVSFDREVAKWEETSNDIVVLAKHMCLIMLQMTDFVRQRGPLKTTTDVISAAKKISETGTKLDKIARQIAEQCPESSTKNDLLAYLERVVLYCHQINIIAKVKTDVQNSNEELILAGVESATSLIENAKNLMNAVVLTVKASYIASTKYSRDSKMTSSIVWKMRTPDKKPLVRLERPKEVKAIIRRASQRKSQHPLKMLLEFQ